MELKRRLANGIVKIMNVEANFIEACVDDLLDRYDEKQLEMIFAFHFISKHDHEKPTYTELYRLLKSA